jgi:hypothetical protein
MKYLIKFTMFFYKKLGYAVIIYKDTKGSISPSSKLNITTKGNVGI